MSFVRVLSVIALFLLSGVNAAATPIPIWSTGADVDNSTGAARDLHWQIGWGEITLDAWVVTNNGYPGAWTPNTAASSWIAPNANYSGVGSAVDPAGEYTYYTRFDLTGYRTETANIQFRYSSDNSTALIALNGVDLVTGYGAPTRGDAEFNGWSSVFSIPVSELSPDWNLLSFTVLNAACPTCVANGTPNPTGIRVEFLAADASLTTPEPATALLIGVALIGLGVFARRRRIG